MLSRRLILSNHASCGTYETEPKTVQSPSIFFICPNNAAIKEDLPDPTSPTIAVILPFLAVKLMFLSEKSFDSPLKFQLNVAFFFKKQ